MELGTRLLTRRVPLVRCSTLRHHRLAIAAPYEGSLTQIVSNSGRLARLTFFLIAFTFTFTFTFAFSFTPLIFLLFHEATDVLTIRLLVIDRLVVVVAGHALPIPVAIATLISCLIV